MESLPFGAYMGLGSRIHQLIQNQSPKLDRSVRDAHKLSLAALPARDLAMYSGMEVNDEMDRGVKMPKLFTLPGITPAKLNHFLPLQYNVPGLINPCPSHHLSPGPSK